MELTQDRAAFSLGQETIFCKTCYLQTDETVYLCVRCYVSSEESHPRYHESWQWTVEVAKPSGLAQGIHCNECLQSKITACIRQIAGLRIPIVIGSMKDLKEHPHHGYADVYAEKNLNQIFARSHRQCQRKSSRIDDMVIEGGDRCTVCLHSRSRFQNKHPATDHCRNSTLVCCPLSTMQRDYQIVWPL